MKTTDLKFEKVYQCNDGVREGTLMYYGMIEDRYCFIPIDTRKRHFTGAPCALSESEVLRNVSELKNNKKTAVCG